jgi:hypothetical protein
MWSPPTRRFKECDFNPFGGPANPPEGVRQLHRIAQQALEQLLLLCPGDLRYSRALDELESSLSARARNKGSTDDKR